MEPKPPVSREVCANDAAVQVPGNILPVENMIRSYVLYLATRKHWQRTGSDVGAYAEHSEIDLGQTRFR